MKTKRGEFQSNASGYCMSAAVSETNVGYRNDRKTEMFGDELAFETKGGS